MSKVQANEVNYELHSLGWKAFQNLCSTIVSEIWGQTVQIFFDSQDGGRDGAFNGHWENREGELYTGTFTVQCKHTTKSDSIIKLSDLASELEKAKRLAKRGLADNYFLFSNSKLTGINDEAIRLEFEKIPEIKKCVIFGGEKISQIIRESKRLRMLVPRVYGLGDLSQILDERAQDQAREILSSLGSDLNKFIITDAYRQSAKALVEHGFVLLLGEPMCGKSTIAAALSMGALDEWGCSTIKIRDADDFVQHFNPNEKQLFWVDDAFGPTQIDFGSAINWSRTFPHVNAAIHKGAKVIFTSRDYVYKSAKRYLKESALPVMKESQVVIHVENLSKEEREQILYNHIKLGNQSLTYKAKIKPFLAEVASNEKFSPEIARRLGNSFFTKELSISSFELNNFIKKPLDMLCEIIDTMDDANRSALALVFIKGGNLPSPLSTTVEEEQAINRIGGTVGDAIKGLESLNGSLLINSINDGCYSWHFKHPTIRDAFAVIVASSPDLMDIYLTGAPLEKIFLEISCGDIGLKGVSVIAPATQYHIIISKIRRFDTSKWFNKSLLYSFLSNRCDKQFLVEFLKNFPNFISKLHVGSYLYASPDVDVLVCLHKFGLLPDADRLITIKKIKELAVSTPDSGFMRDDVKTLISSSELFDILHAVKNDLLPNLENTINEWKTNYNGEGEPDAYFYELRSALDDYKSEFGECEESVQLIDYALEQLDEAISDLTDEYNPISTDNDWRTDDISKAIDISSRSIFDDVDS
ncbi:nSTAND3 domain-containing NTPase [Aeromonas dhakensis]|uniref:nSTAND3 domain-containing NTPase n=1 Tax=Aeromonas dhakensis TaxID=196024 RepID=UPI0038CF49F5